MIKYFYKNLPSNISFTDKIPETERWLVEVCDSEKKQLIELNVIFCSDSYLLKINKKHLQHDYLTDIITFDYCIDNQVIGDLFVSFDRVKANADIFSQSFNDEMDRVIVHGVLHLCGYSDETTSQKSQMKKLEDLYLSLRTQ